ncbi:MAG: serine protease, partial [Pseudomonadota bacterium]
QATNLRDNQPIRTATQQREQAKGLNRRLGVAVVIGPDVEASASIVEDPSIKLENTFDEAALQGELQTMLTQVGFDAVHDVALKDAKRLAQRQMSRFVNMENLEFAADDKKNFEYLLYGNLSEGEGGTRYEFRLIDRQTGAVVGTQRWPDSRYYNAPPRYRDDPDELRAMSRYVTGQLMTQLDARLIDDRLVMEVVVKNVGDVVDIAALADLFKDDPNVIDVGTFNYSMPIGGFEIVYRGSRDNLMDTLRIELPELETPMLVDLYSDRQLVINLRRDVTPQPDVPQEPRAVVPVRKTPPPSEQPVKRDNPLKPVAPVPPVASTESLENHVRRASESVWLIVSEIRRNGYIITRTGTAWTVRDNMLATNAHVVKGLANEMQDAEEASGSVKFFAVKNTNSSVRLELGKVLIHPEYSKTSYAGSAADFALIEVIKGNPGNPLTLAQQQELDMLRPLQRVGYAGFPSGDIRKWGADTVNMQMDVGTISSIGDASLRPTTRTTRRVLTYTIRTRRGASGSPVIGAGGTVIAIHAWGDGADVSFEVRGRDGNVERDQKGQVKTSDIFVSTGFSRGATIDVLSSWLADLDRSGNLP